jgi:hypothetical protein
MIAERVSTDNISSPSTSYNNNNTTVQNNFKTDNLFDGLEFPTVPSNRIIINKSDIFPVVPTSPIVSSSSSSSSIVTSSTLLNPINYDLFHNTDNVTHASEPLLSSMSSSSSSSSSSVVPNKKSSNLSTLYTTEVKQVDII